MPVALLFIDGVGIGRKDLRHNPLAAKDYLLSQFSDAEGARLPEGCAKSSMDSTFGVPGRPQSASNQTAFLTGQPAPQLIGKHVLGFPDTALRKIIQTHSVVRRMVEAKRSAAFLNCYPAGYLDALGLARTRSAQADVQIPERAKRRIRPSATTLSMAAGNVPLRTLDDARSGNGLTHCIDGHRTLARGFEVPERTPEEAAAIFWKVGRGSDFVLFEHFLADEAGHAQDFSAAERALSTFDAFARSVAAQRPDPFHLFICSDHGNVEDLSVRQHTLNPIPILYFGPDPGLLEQLSNLADLGNLLARLAGVPA